MAPKMLQAMLLKNSVNVDTKEITQLLLQRTSILEKACTPPSKDGDCRTLGFCERCLVAISGKSFTRRWFLLSLFEFDFDSHAVLLCIAAALTLTLRHLISHKESCLVYKSHCYTEVMRNFCLFFYVHLPYSKSKLLWLCRNCSIG